MVEVAINGLGRIGRATLKIVMNTPGLDLVAANDLGAADNLVYLLRYDTVIGRYEKRRLTVPPAGCTANRDAGNVPLPPLVQHGEITEEVRRFCAPSLRQSEQPVDIVVSEGNPTKEVVRLGEQLPADLLVLGTHGRSGFER